MNSQLKIDDIINIIINYANNIYNLFTVKGLVAKYEKQNDIPYAVVPCIILSINTKINLFLLTNLNISFMFVPPYNT